MPSADPHSGRLLSIGALSRLSGVPVKTIRFYSDEGLLPPADVTEAGYRRYSEADRARLETIRALRGLELDLEQIGALLDGKRSVREALRLRAEALDVQLRQLTRARTVLTRVTRDEAQDPLVALRRLEVLGQLDALEREQFLTAGLGRAFHDVPVDRVFLDRLCRAAFADLPTELDDDQWEALTELVEVVHDEAFTRGLAEQARPFWTEVQQRGSFRADDYGEASQRLVARALRLVDEGQGPEAAAAQRLADEMLALWARARGRKPTPTFAAEVVAAADAEDPRGERLWRLVAILRRTPPSRVGEAYRFLFEALRRRSTPVPRGRAATRRASAAATQRR